MSSSNASASIPTSTSVLESVVIKAPLSHVWHFIKLQDFSAFWSALSKSEVVTGASNETDVFKWSFKDGTVYEVKQEEHSVRATLPTPHLRRRLVPRLLADVHLVYQPHDHVQRHHLLPRAELLFRPQHHPLPRRHRRWPRQQHLRRMGRSLLQRCQRQ